MEVLIRTFFIIAFSQFLVLCSGEHDTQLFSSYVAGGDSSELIEDDGEEEITAVPPAVISGAHLTCTPLFKSLADNTLDLACYLETEGEVIADVELLASDLVISDENGEVLHVEIKDNFNGIFKTRVSLKDSGFVSIVLKSIGGFDLKENELFTTSVDGESLAEEQVLEGSQEHDDVFIAKGKDSDAGHEESSPEEDLIHEEEAPTEEELDSE